MSDTKSKKILKAWLVFRSGEERYAIDSCMIQEIVRNNEIFPIPFAPPFIKGIINCYSVPVAVIDFSILLGKKETQGKIFLHLKDVSSASIQVTDVEEFIDDAEVSHSDFSNREDMPFFAGAIIYNKQTVPVLDTDAVLQKVKERLGSN